MRAFHRRKSAERVADELARAGFRKPGPKGGTLTAGAVIKWRTSAEAGNAPFSRAYQWLLRDYRADREHRTVEERIAGFGEMISELSFGR
jgi:hypothetical protein